MFPCRARLPRAGTESADVGFHFAVMASYSPSVRMGSHCPLTVLPVRVRKGSRPGISRIRRYAAR